MKKRIMVVSLAAFAAGALWLLGYFMLGGHITSKAAISKYQSVVSNSMISQDMNLSISVLKEISIGNDTFITDSQRTIQYDVDSSENLRVSVQNSLESGSHHVNFREIFADSKLYTTVDGIPFVSSIPESEYTASLFPQILLDETLYDNISGIRKGLSYTILFSNAKKLEYWLTNEEPSDFSGKGRVLIDRNNRITEVNYNACYTINDITYNYNISFKFTRTPLEIQIPENTAEYTNIDHPNSLYALETACGYLLQAENITADYKDNIYLQAMGDRRTQSIQTVSSNDGSWSASMETTTTLTNDIRADQTSQYRKTENFADGSYTATTNDGTPPTDMQVNIVDMRKYVQNQLVSTVMLPQYIRASTVSIESGTIRYSFIGSQEFATYLSKNACAILYHNEDLLEENVNTIQPKVFDCYMVVDMQTGLPLKSGIIFTGEYKVSGVPYLLEYHAEQEYKISK